MMYRSLLSTLRSMNYIDLFSGIGGFALGAYWAGWRFDEHYFSEIDEYAIRVYQQRFPEAINLGDITKIVAYPKRGRKTESKYERESYSQRSNQDMADTEFEGLQRRLQRRECTGELSSWACCKTHEDEWLAQSGIRRVSHGIPHRLDRIKALGNSIVPQIAEIIFRKLKE